VFGELASEEETRNFDMASWRMGHVALLVRNGIENMVMIAEYLKDVNIGANSFSIAMGRTFRP